MAWWENEFLKIKNGKLYLGENESSAIAIKHGTPLFVYSRMQVLHNLRALRDAFSGKSSHEIRILYAMKANFHWGLLKFLKKQGAWIDAVSPGEVLYALKAGFPEKRILFTGTSISAEDLRKVYRHEGVVVNIDAEEQIDPMKEVRDKSCKGKSIRVSIRWNPGIGRGFSPKAVTAGDRSSDKTPIKFGVEESKVLSTFQKAAESGFIPVGFHQHLGSGWVKEDFPDVRGAVDKMVAKASEIQKQGFNLEFLDFGGGFGPQYFESQGVFPLKDYAKHILKRISESDLKIGAIALEPGKYLVGNAGVLLLKVEYVKESCGNLFACVSAGTFNTVPRPAIYTQAQHHILNCTNPGGKDFTKVTVAGNLCETGDIFGKEVLMPRPKRGDVLALLCAGAYCRSMASHFNLREIPKEIFI